MGMLKQIPVGTGFSKRSGQATVNVIRMPGDSIEVIATCDSLARQVILLSEELTRIRNETQEEVEELLIIILTLLKRYLKHRAAKL